MSTKRIVECVGGALGLAAAGWAAYLDISSDGKDTTVMRWYGVRVGFCIVGVGRRARYRKPRSRLKLVNGCRRCPPSCELTGDITTRGGSSPCRSSSRWCRRTRPRTGPPSTSRCATSSRRRRSTARHRRRACAPLTVNDEPGSDWNVGDTARSVLLSCAQAARPRSVSVPSRIGERLVGANAKLGPHIGLGLRREGQRELVRARHRGLGIARQEEPSSPAAPRRA